MLGVAEPDWLAGAPPCQGLQAVAWDAVPLHTFASHAILQGVPLPVVSPLLAHKPPSMTLQYAYVSDSETEVAAECIGAAIAHVLDGRKVNSCGCVETRNFTSAAQSTEFGLARTPGADEAFVAPPGLPGEIDLPLTCSALML